MTQAKHTQQDKIQEIMGLVREMGDAEFYAGSNIKDAAMHDKKVLYASKLEVLIEFKLRELVREPLSDAEIKKHIGVSRGNPSFVVLEAVVRATESAHNITNTSGV